MKFLLIGVLIGILTSVVQSDLAADLKMTAKACLAEAQITETEVTDIFMNPGKMAEAKENFKCYTKCILETQGHMKGGVLNADSLLKFLQQLPQLKDQMSTIENAVKECKNERGVNDCDTAFKVTMCFNKHDIGQQI